MTVTLKRGADIEEINRLLKTVFKMSKGVDVYKYIGKINLNKDALAIQNELRNEWDK